MSAPQKSIRKKPAKYSSILTFLRKDGIDDTKIRLATSSLMKFVQDTSSIPENLDILISINPSIIGYDSKDFILPISNGKRVMPSTQADILVNISAQTTTDILLATRICSAVLDQYMTIQEMVNGGRIRFGQEPFGFYHPENTGRKDKDEIAIIQEGELKGGSWVLMQRYVQDIHSFFKRPISERIEVMGAKPVGYDHIDSKFPPTAHTEAAQAGSKKPLMVRRGFGYDENGQEGTVFIGLSQSTDFIRQTLNSIIDHDALLNFTEAVSGGIYYAPPSPDSLFADGPVIGMPESARPLLFTDEKENAIPLADYTVVESFLDYLNKLRDGGLFEGAVGHMTIDKDVQTLLTAVHQVLSGGTLSTLPEVNDYNEKSVEQMQKDLDNTLTGANLFNLKTGYYMTLG